MCGIFAYLNYGVSRDKRYILEALYKGLRRLEYRGYDSSGLAVDLGAENFTPVVYKAEGKIDALVEEVRPDFQSRMGNPENCLKYLSVWLFMEREVTCQTGGVFVRRRNCSKREKT